MEDVNLDMREPRVYEIGYHVLPTVSEEARRNVVLAMEKIIMDAGGLKISSADPEVKDLAYSMEKIIDNKRADYTRAYFGWIKFDVTPEKVAEIKTALEGMNELLRFVLLGTLREDTSAAAKINAPRTHKPKSVPAEDVPNPSKEESESESAEVVDEVELDSKLDVLTEEPAVEAEVLQDAPDGEETSSEKSKEE
jgi:ribosomal protein S6